MRPAPITAADVQNAKWTTIDRKTFERGGWGYHWESTTFPALQKKIWRPSRHERTRGSLIVGSRHLGVYLLADDGAGFPDHVFAWAARLLEELRRSEAA